MTLKYRIYWLKRWLKRRLSPPFYFVATYGDMGLDVEFFHDKEAYEVAVEAAEDDHNLGGLDTWTHGDIG